MSLPVAREVSHACYFNLVDLRGACSVWCVVRVIVMHWKVSCILFCTFQILNEISQHKIKIYEFPDTEDEEETKLHKVLKDRVPFAVVGSNTVIEVDGKKIRGRKYPWGIAEGAYCDSK